MRIKRLGLPRRKKLKEKTPHLKSWKRKEVSKYKVERELLILLIMANLGMAPIPGVGWGSLQFRRISNHGI